MNLTRRILVTVIVEDELEARLERELLALGATGYSAVTVRGAGAGGVRASEWEGENVRIEVLADEPTADRITEHLARQYMPTYGLVMFRTPVEVLRADKFTARPAGQ